MEILIISGLSGGGKSKAASFLEDMGYYCIDNMPAALLSRFHEIYTQSPGKYDKLAFIMDMRGEVEFDTLDEETVCRYVREIKPYDKAGAYAIQGVASAYIKGIRGDYFNVVGLPVHRMCKLYFEIFGENIF